jgi:hypothetical protein
MKDKTGKETEPPENDRAEIRRHLIRRKIPFQPDAPINRQGGYDFGGLYSQQERERNRQQGWISHASDEGREESAKKRFNDALEDFLVGKWEDRLNVFAQHGQSVREAQAEIKGQMTYYMNNVRVSPHLDESSPLKKLLRAFQKVRDDEMLTPADQEALRNGPQTLENMTKLVLDGGYAPPTMGPILIRAAGDGYFEIEAQAAQRYREAVMPRLEAVLNAAEVKGV